MLKNIFFYRIICLSAQSALYLHCVFHGIRFKVKEDWLSGDNLLLFYESSSPYCIFEPSLNTKPTFGTLSILTV